MEKSNQVSLVFELRPQRFDDYTLVQSRWVSVAEERPEWRTIAVIINGTTSWTLTDPTFGYNTEVFVYITTLVHAEMNPEPPKWDYMPVIIAEIAHIVGEHHYFADLEFPANVILDWAQEFLTEGGLAILENGPHFRKELFEFTVKKMMADPVLGERVARGRYDGSVRLLVEFADNHLVRIFSTIPATYQFIDYDLMTLCSSKGDKYEVAEGDCEIIDSPTIEKMVRVAELEQKDWHIRF